MEKLPAAGSPSNGVWIDLVRQSRGGRMKRAFPLGPLRSNDEDRKRRHRHVAALVRSPVSTPTRSQFPRDPIPTTSSYPGTWTSRRKSLQGTVVVAVPPQRAAPEVPAVPASPARAPPSVPATSAPPQRAPPPVPVPQPQLHSQKSIPIHLNYTGASYYHRFTISPAPTASKALPPTSTPHPPPTDVSGEGTRSSPRPKARVCARKCGRRKTAPESLGLMARYQGDYSNLRLRWWRQRLRSWLRLLAATASPVRHLIAGVAAGVLISTTGRRSLFKTVFDYIFLSAHWHFQFEFGGW